MALSEVIRHSALVTDAGSDIGDWVALQLTRLRPPHDPAVAGRSLTLVEEPLTRALEPRDAIAVRPVQTAVDRPAPMIEIRDVLTAWRLAERALGEIPAGSPDWPRANAELVSLRASYHRLFDERCASRPRP